MLPKIIEMYVSCNFSYLTIKNLSIHEWKCNFEFFSNATKPHYSYYEYALIHQVSYLMEWDPSPGGCAQ